MKIERYDNDIRILQELGNRIKSIRIARSITRDELAKRASVSVSTLQRIEEGKAFNIVPFLAIMRELNFIENFDCLVPEQDYEIDDLYKEPKKRYRASNKRIDENFKWGDEE